MTYSARNHMPDRGDWSSLIANTVDNSVPQDELKKKLRDGEATHHSLAKTVLLWVAVACLCVLLIGTTLVAGAYYCAIIRGEIPSEGVIAYLRKAVDWGLISACAGFFGMHLKSFWKG